MDEDGRTLAAGALLGLLLMGSLRAFFSSIYYHNLTELGLNATALYALLLLAPAALALLPERAAAARVATALLAAFALARAATALGWATPAHLPLAGVAAALGVCALVAFSRASRPGALAAGLGAGIALDASLLLAAASADPLARGAVGVVGSLAAGAAFVLTRGGAPSAPAPGARAPWLPAAGVGAWLFLEHAILGNASHVARWNGLPPIAVGAAIVAGLLAPVVLVSRGAVVSRSALVTVNAVALVALLDHAFVHSPLLLATLPFAQAALVLDLRAALGPFAGGTARRAALAGALAGLVALLLHFAFAFSFTFAYVPLGALWHRAELWLPTLALLILAATALLPTRAAMRWGALRGRPALALAVPALLLLAGAAVAPSPAVDPVDEGASLRVATFNLHQGFNNDAVVDADVFVQAIRELDADLVALQESDTPRFTSANLDIVAYVERHLGYHVIYGPPTREQSVGVALLSRLPVEEWRVHRLPTTTDNRFVLEARLDAGSRGDLWVFATHFGLELPDRDLQADALLRIAGDRSPRILVGDFNSCPTGKCPDFDGAPDAIYARLVAEHADAWVERGHDPDDAAGFTYDARDPSMRIDYVFLHGLEVADAVRVRSGAALQASDHLPVVVDVRWS